MELGDKLRQARIQAGLSQRELCGDTITRNMLSQIEHGNASPSIGTLQALAARLGKPVGYFLDGEGPASPNAGRMAEAVRAVEAENWDRAGQLLEEFQQPDPVYDGVRELLSQLVLLALTDRAIDEERLPYARELLGRLRSFPGQRQRLQQRLEQPGEECLDPGLLLRAQRALDRGERERAWQLLQAAEDQTSPRWMLLRGRLLAAEQDYARARDCLLRAEEACPEEAAPLLEQCFRELEDYKMAYYYACRQK